jgi:hypothetical protein
MIKFTFIILFAITIGQVSLCQEQIATISNDTILIPIGTELTIQVDTTDINLKNFKILNQSKVAKPIELTRSFYSQNPKNKIKDVIEFTFSYANVMQSKKIVLNTRHLFSDILIFKARIKYRGRDKFVETSIMQELPYIISTELWQSDIEVIELSNFKKIIN